jgi:hypothetical protein
MKGRQFVVCFSNRNYLKTTYPVDGRCLEGLENITVFVCNREEKMREKKGQLLLIPSDVECHDLPLLLVSKS